MQKVAAVTGRDWRHIAAHMERFIGEFNLNLKRLKSLDEFYGTFQLSTVESCLAQTIFMKNDDETGYFHVNFNSRVLQMFQEVHCAFQCGIRVPNISAFIYSRKNVLLRMKDEAQVTLTRDLECSRT